MNINRIKTNTIKRVAIVGGVHGNELVGGYLIKKLERSPHLVQRSSFESLPLLANPEAFAAGRRYIERDLNRCFLNQDLNNPLLSSYEDQRAKAINQLLGPKENPQVDFIVDLHSTSANMGVTIIPSSKHPFNLQLAAHLSTLTAANSTSANSTSTSANSTFIQPSIQIYYWPYPDRDQAFLRSICNFSCTIEIGAIAPGTLDPTLFQQTEEVLLAILDYLEAYNQGQRLFVPPTLTIYQGAELVDYPRNANGELQAMIHPDRQFKDYQPLHPGEPLFLTFEGETLLYKGDSTVYPVFINEAAYYEKGIAMCLTNKQHIASGAPVENSTPAENSS